MDNHERKRREYIANTLASAVVLIRVMLLNLDGISLAVHEGTDVRDRIADDFMQVYANILPNVEAPSEVVALIRSLLVDWVNLDSLVNLVILTGDLHPARGDAAEELADRISMTLTAARDIHPGLFGLEE